MELLVIFGVALLVAGWFAGEPLLVELRRARLRRRPFPDAWREIIRRRVPYFRLLPADLQIQLKRHIGVFIAEKPFIGCDGLEVTDEMRVAIAAWSARETYRTHLNDLGKPGAAPVPKPEYDRLREQAQAA